MNIEDFDLNFAKELKILIDIADKKFPKRCWTVKVVLFTDTDFVITLDSAWGTNAVDRFIYKKSDSIYEYEKVKNVEIVEKYDLIKSEILKVKP